MGLWDRISRTLGELSEELLPGELRDRLDGARELLSRGSAGAALAALDTVLAERPGHATALYLRGEALRTLGRHGEAEPALLAALAARPAFTEAEYALGEVLLARGDHDAALARLRAALAHAGGDPMLLGAIYRALGAAHLAAGAPERALRELRKALAEDPAAAEIGPLLADALARSGDRDGDAEEARAPLERALRAAGAAPPASVLLALGRLEARAGHLAEAEGLLERLLEQGPAVSPPGDARRAAPSLAGEALLTLGDLASRRGAHAAAHERLEAAALELPGDPRLLTLSGDVLAAAGNPSAALGAWERAHAAGADVTERAVHAAIAAAGGLAGLARGGEAQHGDPAQSPDAARVAAWATRLLARHPDAAPIALAARGLALAGSAEPAAARVALEQSLAAGPTAIAHVALGALLEAAGEDHDALRHARAALALAPRAADARALFLELRRRTLGLSAPPGGGSDGSAGRGGEAPLIDEPAPRNDERARTFAGWVALEPSLATLAGDVARLLEALERPLLVTVMGEFSAGKSTFVNAFLGAAVAPTGITPTTATINVLRQGRVHAARIRYADDTTRELAWAEVPRALSTLGADEARRVRLVELFVPLAALARVSLVDTPGLNSILPEHEETARRFIAEADAVLWLFTAGQAGKASERDALDRIRAEGKRVLGVLNKIDQVAPADVAPLRAHLDAELGATLEDIVPLSARRALAARTAAIPDPAELAASGWVALEAALEARFFSRARELKAEACARRLAELVATAQARVAVPLEEARARAASLRGAAGATHAAAAAFAGVPGAPRRTGSEPSAAFLDAERRRLAEAVAAAYRTAARELLELVRPRRVPFGEHQASPADRDYLRGLLERALADVLHAARGRILDALDQALGPARAAAATLEPAAAAALARAGDDARRVVLAEGLEHARGFVRGTLRGGALDLFFTRELPRIELTEDAIHHALVRDAPALDTELLTPLHRAVDAALRRLADQLEEAAALDELAAEELDVLAVALASLGVSIGQGSLPSKAEPKDEVPRA